jgi:hypothetical protein
LISIKSAGPCCTALSETLRRLRRIEGMGQRMKRDWLDDKDVIQMLRAEVERAGSQRAFAIKVGLTRNNVNKDARMSAVSAHETDWAD